MRMIARFDGARRSIGLGLALALGVAVVGLTDARTQEADPKETSAGITMETEPAQLPVDTGSTEQADEPDPVDAPTVSPARQRIMAKLDRIILPEVEFNGVPLREVISRLALESQRLDPDQKGVNFIVNHHLHAPRNSEEEPADLMEVNVHLTPPLKNVRLRDVLDTIVKTAESPIRYTIEDYAIVVTWPDPSTRSDAGSPPLFSRTFNVDPQLLIRELKDWRARRQRVPPDGEGEPNRGLSDDPLYSSTPSLSWMLRDYLSAAGADFWVRGKSVFINDRLGKVFVRATMQDIEIVERVIQNLGKPSKRVQLEVKVIEISPSAFEELTIIRTPGNSASVESFTSLTAESLELEDSAEREDPSNQGTGPRTNIEIHSDPRFQEVLRALERHGNARTLSDHRVITLSGRTTRFRANDDRQRELGVDVIPNVLPGVSTLEMTFRPVPKDVLAIMDTSQRSSGEAANDASGNEPAPERSPDPTIALARLASMTLTMKWDSGTVMFVGATMADDQTGEENLMLMGELPLIGRFFKIRDRTPTRSYLFLIKGTVIESAVDPVEP
jgi:hypothetical protein